MTSPLPSRLIPAHAGKTTPRRRTPLTLRAHPRSRGENAIEDLAYMPAPGSSPLTRGKRQHDRARGLPGGLIPAHAGKTVSAHRRGARPQAHPRSRGENGASWPDPAAELGSSPLTRGKHGGDRSRRARSRLIPAHAGKTRSARSRYCPTAAHPRSRGENPAAPALPAAGPGLIPAHAGKTSTSTASQSASRAHPRSRGENTRMSEAEQNRVGSSPLTRGKRLRKEAPRER